MAAGDEGHLVCGQSAFRAIAAVTQWAFHSPKAAMQRTPASGKGSAENRAAIPARASILPRSWHWARAAPPTVAARTRIVSVAGIRLDPHKSKRLFNG